MEERLQKIIAQAGIASRRHAELLIRTGQVSVNGKVVTELGSKADPLRDHIKVRGKLLHGPQRKVYLILHKPAACVSTLSDPQGRPTIRDSLGGFPERVFPLGGLEYHAQGLLLLTNDGELANRIQNETQRLAQTFWIKVKGRLREEERKAAQGRSGARIHLLKDAANAWYEVALPEAGERVRAGDREALERALVETGHPVEKWKRVELANLELGELEPGEYRILTPEEVAGLERAVARACGEAGTPAGAKQGPAPHGAGQGPALERVAAQKEPRRSALDTRAGKFRRR